MSDPEAGFELHPRLAADTIFIKDLPLSRMLLMSDARYPWVILVPRRVGMREWYELGDEDRLQLLRESCALSEFMQREFAAQKMNLGALGNLVPQLHLHHIVRNEGDAAWPGPAWGQGNPRPHGEEGMQWRDRLSGLQIKHA